VRHSVISGGSVIGRDAVVCDSVIMDDVVIEPGAEVYYAIVDSETVIRSGVRVGSPDAGKDRITVIAKGSDVTKNVEGK
ncbi:MAG: glucose-1-phosphate adenylyltransferase, partial [Clostridia bacterium]|nr:glucose-1-phosphate adenylyltransferase [Clostridia bacterium]